MVRCSGERYIRIRGQTFGVVGMASSIDGNSLAQAFISARELDASQGEQLSAFATPAGAAGPAAPPATHFLQETPTRGGGPPHPQNNPNGVRPPGLPFATSLTGPVLGLNISKTP